MINRWIDITYMQFYTGSIPRMMKPSGRNQRVIIKMEVINKRGLPRLVNVLSTLLRPQEQKNKYESAILSCDKYFRFVAIYLPDTKRVLNISWICVIKDFISDCEEHFIYPG